MALGGDQAGSIRMPAAFCGCYGLKPTYGLVPYSGIFQSDRTLDHIGPMTRTVSDAAALLGAIAGPDGIDPRQLNTVLGDYEATLEDGIDGMRIGLLTEGFGWPNSEPDVDEAVRTTANQLTEQGEESNGAGGEEVLEGYGGHDRQSDQLVELELVSGHVARGARHDRPCEEQGARGGA